jgi:hypothetical protein
MGRITKHWLDGIHSTYQVSICSDLFRHVRRVRIMVIALQLALISRNDAGSSMYRVSGSQVEGRAVSDSSSMIDRGERQVPRPGQS